MGRLQRGKDPECKLFQEMAEHGHYRGRVKPSATRQGIYALAPSGVFLASVNTRNPGAVLRMLARALERWAELSPEKRRGADMGEVRAKDLSRWEKAWPEGGLVLRVNSRDLPRKFARPDWRSRAWNVDHAWFTASEALEFVPVHPAPGKQRDIPASLARRLARCHLLDNVRGQTPSWKKESVKEAALTTEVIDVKGSRVRLRMSGKARISQSGQWSVAGFRDMKNPAEHVRAFDATLLGRATFDLSARRFTSFELVAAGMRRGGTQFNARSDDPGPAPMGIVFTLAGPNERVAPAGIWSYGWKRP